MYRQVLAVKVSAIVVSHGNAAQLEQSLPALLPQVDELLVIANVPGSAPPGTEALENRRPRGFAANLNAGIARTTRRCRARRESRRRAGAGCGRRAP